MLMRSELYRISKIAAASINLYFNLQEKTVPFTRYFLMTSLSNQENEELPDSRYRPVNLFRAPFYLPAPLCVAKDTVESAEMYAMLSDANTIAIA